MKTNSERIAWKLSPDRPTMWFAYELLFRTKDDSWNRWYHLKDRAKVVNFNLQIGPEMVNLDKKTCRRNCLSAMSHFWRIKWTRSLTIRELPFIIIIRFASRTKFSCELEGIVSRRKFKMIWMFFERRQEKKIFSS